MTIAFLDCVHAAWDNTNKKFTFKYPIYDGLKNADVVIGKIPVSGGIRSGSVTCVVSTSSPYNITIDAGSSVGAFTVTAAAPNVATLNQ